MSILFIQSSTPSLWLKRPVIPEFVTCIPQTDNWESALENAQLVIVEPEGAFRGAILRKLYDARIPFALVGLRQETPDQCEHIARTCKKKHIPSCWIGSFRFFQSIARAKEFVNSGILGNIRGITFTGTQEALSGTTACRDLSSWLPGNGTVTIDWKSDSSLQPDSFTIDVSAVLGTLRIKTSLKQHQPAQLTVDMTDAKLNHRFDFPEEANSEFSYLLSVITHANPWHVLPQITLSAASRH